MKTNKITVNVANLSEEERDRFIEGFESVLRLDDHDSPAPWCMPWLTDDEITVERPADGEDFHRALGRAYAREVAPEVTALVGDMA